MSTDNKVFKLKSSDDKIFEVDKLVACQLQTLQPLLEDTCPDTILLPNITGKILSKVIEYCRYHGESSQQIFDEELAKNKIKEWEVEFVKVDDDILFLLMDAADDLNIKNLLDLTFKTAGDIIKSYPLEEIRRLFTIHNDFTSEEEEKVRRDNQWAFGPSHNF